MARVRGSDFGETVLAVRADDSELRATLAKDEAFVRTSTAKMQGSLNQLNVPIRTLTDASGDLGTAFGVAGAGASFLGGRMGSLVSQTVSLGSALRLASKELLGLLARFVLPIIPIAVVVGLFVRELGKLSAAEREAEEALATTEAKVLAADKRRSARLKVTVAAEAAAAKAIREAERSAALIVSDRLRDLEREILVIEGKAKVIDFITNKYERQLTIQRNQLQVQQQQAEAVEREKQARDALISAQGPQTRPEAQTAITQALTLFNAQQRAMFELRTLARDLLATGRITQDQFRAINQRFGLGAVGAATRNELADRVGGLAIPATRFTDIGAFAGGARDPAAKRDEARNILLKQILRLQRQGVRLN